MDRPEHDAEEPGEATLSGCEVPYAGFCRDVDALRRVNVQDQAAVFEAITRLERMGRASGELIGGGWDERFYQDVFGISLADSRTILSFFEEALARLKRVQGVDFAATGATLATCRALAVCMEEFIGRAHRWKTRAGVPG